MDTSSRTSTSNNSSHHNNSNNNSSSGGNNHYSALLTTVSELRNDLERSMNKMNALESQNQQLRGSYESLKEELVDTRKKYNEAQENYMATVASKFDMERQNESFMEMLKLQLTEKTKEFEAIRDSFAPQDVDKLTIKIQEELELPHRQKVQALTDELEQHQDLYHATQRELDRVRAEFEVYAENQAREALQTKHEHEGAITSLRAAMLVLEERGYTNDKDEQIRALKFKVHEMENTLEGLRGEIKNIQGDRDDAAVGFEKDRTRFEVSLGSMRSKLCVADSERQANQQRCNQLTHDLEVKDGALRAAKKAVEEASIRVDVLTNQLSDAHSKLAGVKEDFAAQLANEVANHEAVQKQQAVQLDDISSKLYEREDVIRKLQRETADFQLRSERRENDIRKEMNLQIQELKQQIYSLELECADVKNQVRSAGENLMHSNAQNEAEIERLRAETSRILREKEVLLGKLRESESRLEAQRKRDSEAKRILSDKHQSATLEVNRLNATVKMQGETADGLHSRIAALESENQGLNTKINALNTAHAQALEAAQRNAKERFDALAHSYKDKLHKMQSHYRHATDKEKKKSEAYKAKAIQAHNVNKVLSGNIEAMQAMADI